MGKFHELKNNAPKTPTRVLYTFSLNSYILQYYYINSGTLELYSVLMLQIMPGGSSYFAVPWYPRNSAIWNFINQSWIYAFGLFPDSSV